MRHLQNLHTHSTYCDGKNTPEEMVEAAISKGFNSLGFSGHSFMFYSPYKSGDHTKEYKAHIRRLKEEYKDRFPIYLGLEFDMYSVADLTGFDYLLGACHYFKFDDNYVGFDRDAEVCRKVINEYFGGDGLKFAIEYYRQLSLLPKYGSFDILAHFDLITKNLELEKLFDTEDKRYFSAAVEALEALKGKVPLFEVNTGAIARGYRTTPYPSKPLMKEMKRLGFGAVITSDCHDAAKLDCKFDLAEEWLLECGFREHYVLTDNGFKPFSL